MALQTYYVVSSVVLAIMLSKFVETGELCTNERINPIISDMIREHQCPSTGFNYNNNSLTQSYIAPDFNITYHVANISSCTLFEIDCWNNVTCYFETPESSWKMCFKLEYQKGTWEESKSCDEQSCHWLFPKWHSDAFDFDVKIQPLNSSCDDSKHVVMYRVHRQAILQLPPVTDLTAVSKKRGIIVKWTYPHDALSGKRVFRVRVANNLNASAVQVYYMCKRPRLQLNDIHANSMYSIKVEVLPIVRVDFNKNLDRGQGYWSEPRCASVQTSVGVPAKAPVVHWGSFYISDSREKAITIFTKPVDLKDARGPIEEVKLCTHTTRVTTGYDSNTAVIANQSCYSCKVDSVNKCINLNLGFQLKGDQGMTFSVSARTSKGYNKSLSLTQIPVIISNATIQAKEKLKSFEVAGERPNIVHIKWPHLDNCRSYTVYWCQRGSLSHCRDDAAINWTVITDVSLPGTSLVLDKSVDAYAFAISGELVISGQLYSTGMVFYRKRDCVYDVNMDIVSPPGISAKQGFESGTISTEWINPSCEESGFIDYYVVKTCVVGVGEEVCDEMEKVVQPGFARNQTYTISSLRSDHKYRVLIQSCQGDFLSTTIDRLKNGTCSNYSISNDVFLDKPTTHILHNLKIGVIVLFVLFIVIALSLILGKCIHHHLDPLDITPPPAAPEHSHSHLLDNSSQEAEHCDGDCAHEDVPMVESI